MSCYNDEGATSRRSSSKWAQHLRSVDDSQMVDRTWQRLSQSTSQSAFSRRKAPALRVLGSVALLCAGMLMGVYVERQNQNPEAIVLRSEQWAPQAWAGEEPDELRPELQAPQSAPQQPQRQDEKRVTPLRQRRPIVNRRASAPGASASSATEVTVEETPVEEEVVVAPAKSAWMVLAERGDFSGAFQELDVAGGFDQALLAAGPDELMILADVARSVSRPGRAIQALRIVLDQYRDNENAPLAAMMLGNLLSRAGDVSGAAKAFALNRRLSPGGDFAEDALVREFDMAVVAKNISAAERLRAQYEREYPDGRHRDALQGDLDRLVTELAPTARSSSYDAAVDDDESDDQEDAAEEESEIDLLPSSRGLDTSAANSSPPSEAPSGEPQHGGVQEDAPVD